MLEQSGQIWFPISGEAGPVTGKQLVLESKKISYSWQHNFYVVGYSLEVPQRGTSNEYPQHIFCGEIRKIFCGYPLLSWAMSNEPVQMGKMVWIGPFHIDLKIPFPLIYEPVHNKTYNKTCVTSKDQPIHPPSMTMVLIYPSLDSLEADAKADLSLCWSHKSYCRFCCVLAHIAFILNIGTP